MDTFIHPKSFRANQNCFRSSPGGRLGGSRCVAIDRDAQFQRVFWPRLQPRLSMGCVDVGLSARSHFLMSRIIDMYGPPQSCKRKTRNGKWSALMYSALVGVRDSGPWWISARSRPYKLDGL